MSKYNLIIDVAECTNCNLCTLATMDEYVGNEWPGVSAPMPRNGHNWIRILTKERGQVPMIDVAFVPTMCNHCDDAPCMKKDTRRRDHQARRRHRHHRSGHAPRGRSSSSMPAPTATSGGTRNWRCRRRGRSMRICSTAAGRRRAARSRARRPRCRSSSSTTRRWRRRCASEKLEVLKPELGTKPRVYYKNLWRYTTAFIGGSVSEEKRRRRRLRGGRDRAPDEGRPRNRQGDDRQLRRLQARPAAGGLGRLHASISSTPGGARRASVTLGESINLGEIRI